MNKDLDCLKNGKVLVRLEKGNSVKDEEGIDFSLYLPLIQETANKVKELSPRQAQTGPMVRYDKKIMDAQIALINDERTRQIYRLMADSIHEDSSK